VRAKHLTPRRALRARQGAGACSPAPGRLAAMSIGVAIIIAVILLAIAVGLTSLAFADTRR
jgi:hypothetical protein